MRNNYLTSLKTTWISVLFLLFSYSLQAQPPVTQTYNFTGAITHFTVPPCVSTLTIQAWGARGGSILSGTTITYPGGSGAYMSGVFAVTTGQVLRILVGGPGGDLSTVNCATGGGGGSFVASISNTTTPIPMLIAGGGGGRRDLLLTSTLMHGINTTNGQPCVATPGTAGTGGNGGTSNEPLGLGTGGPGGGYYTNGGPCGSPGGATPGFSFLSGGSAAITCSPFTSGTSSNGGFGGGGAGCWCYRGTPGGGGGYSGGGTGMNEGCSGGGGSYNGGTNQIGTMGVNYGSGVVTITYGFNGFGVAATATSYSICSGTSVNLVGSNVVTYTWTPGGSNSSSITVTPTVTSTYTVNGTNSLGCISNSIMTIAVDNTPTVTAIASNTTNGICPNSPLTLTGSGATAYSWSGGVINAVPFNPTTSATYTVMGTNACGSATAAVSLSIHPIPPVTASVNNPTICSGNSVVLNGGGAITYTWTPSAPNNIPFFPQASQNYTVRGTSALGCTASAVQGVTVLITPTITPVVTPTAMCLGGTATLSGVGATGYTWTPGNNLTAATVTVSPPGPTTYTLFRTNGVCVNTSTVFLNIYALPLVNASGTPNQICAGTGVNLVVVGPITNTWLPGGFTVANFTVFPNFSTTYTVIGSNGNCTATAVVPVTVSPSPTVGISTSTLIICEGQNVTLTANGTGLLTYTWQPSGGNNQVEVVSPMVTTLYTLTAENSFSCTTSVNQVIVVNPLPNMNLTSNLPYICAGNTASLSIASITPNVVYNWNTGPIGPSILVSPTITTNYFATGTNTITGCQNTNTIALAVYISTFAVSGPTAICKGQTAVFSAAGDASTYAWSANGSPVGGAPSVTVSPVLSTTYYVVGTNVSCTSTLAVPLIVNPIPNVTAIAAKSQICRFEVSTISGNGATSYSWNTGASTPTISFTLSITTTYTVTGTDVNGCAKTVTVTQFVATCIGLEDQHGNGNTGLSVYPNPNNGTFFIRSDVNVILSIVNTLGQVVSTLELSEENKKEVTVSSLPTGIYFITGEANGLKVNKKVVIEK